ncbi:MAG: phosphodiester glycosidase family protein [Pseudomonadota bacterium]
MRFNAPLALGVLALLLSVVAIVAVAAPKPRPQPCVDMSFEGDLFLVCAFDSRREDLRFADRGAEGVYLRSFRALRGALGNDAARVRYAMNAGMFDDDGEPIGLYVEAGAEKHGLNTAHGPGNFHMLPNGVFSADSDGALHVETTDAYALRAPHPQWATQSGPMLVINDELHPAIQPNGASLNIRNGVGVRDAHHAFFVISEAPVSFGRLARFFRDRLHCANALYLDGSVSSVWAPARGRMDRGHLLWPMLVALERPRS